MAANKATDTSNPHTTCSGTTEPAGMSHEPSNEALSALVCVWNKCPTEVVDNATPYELWHGWNPDISYLRPLGSIPTTLVPARWRENGPLAMSLGPAVHPSVPVQLGDEPGVLN
ncbi:hypothetical protein BDN67DRAFT_984974 [Paxillus ammoniavirescens]|nr:hypothetical protein BDN67DRAFT_984974 [Paxillus ammoniavirescens]